MEADKSKICSVGWQAKDPGELMVQMKSKGHLLQNSLLLRGGQPFVLFKLSAERMRPTHPMEDNLLYSKSIDLNVHSSKNTLLNAEMFRII